MFHHGRRGGGTPPLTKPALTAALKMRTLAELTQKAAEINLAVNEVQEQAVEITNLDRLFQKGLAEDLDERFNNG